MKFIVWLCMLWLSFSSSNSNAVLQQKRIDSIPDPVAHPQFVSPLRIPLSLSANFCEVRKDHYHMGLDIRTQQRENIAVYAVEDGYVSRVGISNQGYGKVIYIHHKNGYTSVYAHLNSFYTELEQAIHKLQYANESWETDVHFAPNEFPVSKNQFIALSGNTGASAGPHLHFEIRETKSGRSVNPQTVGIAETDKIPPAIHGLYLYDRSRSTYFQTPQKLSSSHGVIRVNTPLISIGIRTDDKNNSSGFTMGIYSATVLHNNTSVFNIAFDRFPFVETRYVNGGIDYKEWALKGSKIQHLSRLPGNLHEVYTRGSQNGIIHIGDGQIHTIDVVVEDVQGNKKTSRFSVQYSGKENAYAASPNLIIPNKEAHFKTTMATVELPTPSVYDTASVQLTEVISADKDAVSKTWAIGDEHIPVHVAYTVRLKAEKAVHPQHVIMILSGLKNYKSTIKPSYENGWFVGHFNKFGKAYLAADSVPPTISTVQNNSKHANSIRVTVTDNFGKIASFRGEVDGRWVKFVPHGHHYVYTFDEHCDLGPHSLTITAEDVAGNRNTVTTNFIRVQHIAPTKSASPTKKTKHVSPKKRR